jgi:hypothetical protein
MGRGCCWLHWQFLVVPCRHGVTGEKQHALRSEKRETRNRAPMERGCRWLLWQLLVVPCRHGVTGEKDEERGIFLIGQLGAGRGQVREAAFEAAVADVLAAGRTVQGRVGGQRTEEAGST